MSMKREEVLAADSRIKVYIGDLYLDGLTSAQGLKLPEGNLRYYGFKLLKIFSLNRHPCLKVKDLDCY